MMASVSEFPDWRAVLDEVQALGRCRYASEMAQAMDRIAGRLAVDFYAYHIVRAPGSADPGPWYVTSYPQGWVREYFGEGYTDHDPVLRQAAQGVAPFQWRRLPITTPQQRQVMEGAQAHRLLDGFTVPLKSDGEFAALTFAFDLTHRDMDDWLARYASFACMAGMYVHDAARQVFFQQDASPEAHLTARERQCVQWMAAGKTSWEIGGILGISEKTAHIHLQNAMAKLNVATRPQLVARAFWLGILNSL